MTKLEAKIILSGVDNASRPLQNSTKNTKLLSEQLLKTQAELKNLNKVQSNLSGFTQLKKQFEDAKETTKKLAIQLNQTQEPTKKLQKAFEKTRANTKKLKEQLDPLRATLQQSGVSTKNLVKHQITLRSQINNANKSIEQQRTQLTRLNERMKKSNQIRQNYDKGMQRIAVMGGVGYGSLATGRTITRGMRNLLGVGYEFDASMSSTQAVTRIADKDDPRMLALREQARTRPLYSKFTDSEVAGGQYFLGRTGYKADQILKAMPGMLNLASAGDLDLATTADIASNIQMAMGIPAEKMDHVADVMTAMFTRNNVDIQMLGESLKYSAGIGAAFGQSLETVTAATAMMGNAGIQGSQAGTTLRQILTRIGTSEAVAKLGVKTKDKNGNMRDLVDILAEISKATKHMGNVNRAAINKQIAGQIGLTGFEILLSKSANGELKKLRGKKGEYDGEAERVAKLKLDNLKGDMTMLHAAFENISVELFEKNNAWLRKATQGFTEFLHSIGEFLKHHPAISKGLVMIGAGLAALTTAFGGLALTLMSVFGPMLMTKFILAKLGLSIGSMLVSLGSLGGAIKVLGSIFAFVGRLFLAHPIGFAITAIALAALAIYKYWEPIKTFFSSIWRYLSEKFNELYNYFANLPEKIGSLFSGESGIMSIFTNLGSNLIDGLMDGIRNKWNQLKSTISELTDGVTGWFKDALGIHSPSRLFAEYGGFTVEGFRLGVERHSGRALSSMSNLSNQISEKRVSNIIVDNRAPVSPIISYNSAKTPSQPQIFITVNAGPKMNEHELANKVGQEVSRYFRSKQNNYRNSYRDID